MTRSLSDLAQGRYPLLRPMRKGDELGDFFDLFRKSIDLLHTRDMEEAYKIEAAALALQPHCASKEAQSAVEVLQALAVQKRAQTRSAGEAPGVGGRG
jgi:RNA 3'-terminal phosphate cyclase